MGVEAMAHKDDEVRIARALMDGRSEVFEQFVDAFRTRIFQYSYLMCGHREDAEEVAQDTLLKAFENMGSLREPERIRSWVFRIAKNACLMKRRRSIFAPPSESSLEERDAGLVAGSEVAPDELVLQAEMQDALTAAIRELPPNYRSVLLLRDIEELSTEEAAEILELNTATVKQRLHRARLALRKNLEQRLRPDRGRPGNGDLQ
jgi:RNA polymerase sigma-70 factor (ECF subfamily)